MGRRALRTAALTLLVVAVVTLPVPVVSGAWPEAVVLAVVAALAWGVARLVGAVGQLDHGGKIERLSEAALTWTFGVVAVWVATLVLATVASGGGAVTALRDPVSALFEATSGLTTTGLSMVGDPSSLPSTMQWWRTVLQGTGAVGVVVFGLLIGEPSGDRDVQIGTEWSVTPPGQGREVGRRILVVFLGIVTVGFVGLLVGGDPWWRALNHAITAAATGGFAITADSAGSSAPAARVALATTGVLGAISFGTIYASATRSGPRLWRRTQIRTAGVAFLVTAVPAIGFSVAAGADAADVAFNAVSASTTTGFSAGDSYDRLPIVAFLTTAAMLVGGSAGSSAGGMKTARVAWIAKSVARFLPSEAVPDEGEYRWDGEHRDNDESLRRIVGAGVLVSIWVAATALGVVVLRATVDAGVTDLLVEVSSALSTTGLSAGVTDSTLAAGPKLVLVALMLTGRLEITAFIALAAYAGGQRRARTGTPGDEQAE